jgi:hypothetical protein
MDERLPTPKEFIKQVAIEQQQYQPNIRIRVVIK